MVLHKEGRIKFYKRKLRKLVIYMYHSCRQRGLAYYRKWTYFQQIILILVAALLLYASGIYQYLIASSFEKHYIHWGPNVSLEPLFEQHQLNQVPSIEPVNAYNWPYIYSPKDKCALINSEAAVSIVYVIKSSIDNLQRRDVIRKTWGQENRLQNVVVRTVFLLGIRPGTPNVQELVDAEVAEYGDIVQGEFLDSYFNNTIKTMMGLHWTYQNCPDAKYLFFADDDYYISTKNVLQFLQDPFNYPKFSLSGVRQLPVNLYAGFVFENSAPIRWIMNKWYVSLKEYQYSYWPPYVTAGAYILSRRSLERLYVASLYTSHFRFDDVYLGMASKKAGLSLLHNKEFYFTRKPYSIDNYKWVIASHEWGDPSELHSMWTELLDHGYA